VDDIHATVEAEGEKRTQGRSTQPQERLIVDSCQGHGVRCKKGNDMEVLKKREPSLSPGVEGKEVGVYGRVVENLPSAINKKTTS